MHEYEWLGDEADKKEHRELALVESIRESPMTVLTRL
jgi:hypothetical protein